MLRDNGYFDVPAGKLAAVVTSLEMFAPPALRPERTKRRLAAAPRRASGRVVVS